MQLFKSIVTLTMNRLYKVLILISFVALIVSTTACAGLAGVAADAALDKIGGDSKGGIELTAQVGKENNKGLVNTKVEFADEIEFDDVAGSANVHSGNSIVNKTSTMIGLVLAGMLPPLLLLFY